MSAKWMPPLPEPDVIVHYTADQMRQAQADAARAALEQAAKVCDDIAFDWHKHAAGGPVAAYSACADAIRALISDIGRNEL